MATARRIAMINTDDHQLDERESRSSAPPPARGRWHITCSLPCELRTVVGREHSVALDVPASAGSGRQVGHAPGEEKGNDVSPSSLRLPSWNPTQSGGTPVLSRYVQTVPGRSPGPSLIQSRGSLLPAERRIRVPTACRSRRRRACQCQSRSSTGRRAHRDVGDGERATRLRVGLDAHERVSNTRGVTDDDRDLGRSVTPVERRLDRVEIRGGMSP